jgi:hypothetical protein
VDTGTTTPRQDLVDLNEAFLVVLADHPEAGAPVWLRPRLVRLEKPQRRRLAALPLALFSLGFEDAQAWERLLSPCVRDELSGGHAAGGVERFTLLALSIVRGLAQLAPRQASAWAGLPPATGTRLAALRLGELAAVAPRAAGKLRPRRAADTEWWLRLVDACQQGDERQLALLGGFGMQWTIRRSLGLAAPGRVARGFRR